MRPVVFTAALMLSVATPAFAQTSMQNMPGMGNMPGMQPPPTPHAAPAHRPRRHPRPAATHPAPVPPPAHGMSSTSGMSSTTTTTEPDSSTDQSMPGMPGMNTAEEAVGNAPAPEAPAEHAADRYFDPAAMAAARAQLQREHGGAIVSKVMLNLAEVQFHRGESGYRWEGEAWIGGDINRFVLKGEGEAANGVVSSGEVQALYSHAIGPYFDVQAGLRQDIEPRSVTYATVGFEGVAPYWFETSGALFFSLHGDVLGRLEGTYDLRLTQRWILQPRAEINLSAQDVPESRIGAGVSDVELGLRLRYDITRNFSPYVGVSYQAKTGATADFARADGEDAEQASIVLGLRAWF